MWGCWRRCWSSSRRAAAAAATLPGRCCASAARRRCRASSARDACPRCGAPDGRGALRGVPRSSRSRSRARVCAGVLEPPLSRARRALQGRRRAPARPGPRRRCVAEALADGRRLARRRRAQSPRLAARCAPRLRPRPRRSRRAVARELASPSTARAARPVTARDQRRLGREGRGTPTWRAGARPAAVRRVAAADPARRRRLHDRRDAGRGRGGAARRRRGRGARGRGRPGVRVRDRGRRRSAQVYSGCFHPGLWLRARKRPSPR